MPIRDFAGTPRRRRGDTRRGDTSGGRLFLKGDVVIARALPLLLVLLAASRELHTTAADVRATRPAAESPVKVIFDTDMDSDCDDLGALAVLHALADRGEVEILATVTSSQNPWSA